MLIGLVGLKGTGKSTVASYLVDTHNFKEHSFAEPLKQICLQLGAPYKSLYGTQLEKEQINDFIGISGRHLMQCVGTELFRNRFYSSVPNFNMGKHKIIWVRLMELWLQNHSNENIVISDCRFPDELDLIKSFGGIVIKIQRKTSSHIDNHSSEQHVKYIDGDITIDNNGTINSLYNQINRKLNL